MGSLRFEVVDELTGDPLPALVRLGHVDVVDLGDTPSGVVASHPVGTFTFQVQHGYYSDLGSPGTGASVTATVTEDEQTLVRVEMSPPGKVRFRAIDDVDGSPLTQLNTYVSSRIFGVIGLPTSAGGDGWFEMETYPAPHPNFLTVYDAKYIQGYVTIELPPIASNTAHTIADPLVIGVQPQIDGTVVDPDGLPVQGALVVLADSDGRIHTERTPTTTTDALGRFSFALGQRSALVLALPPADRTELAAGGPAPGGLRGAAWPAGETRPTVEIVLPEGRWIPAANDRTAPTASEPVTVTKVLGSAGDRTGVNVLAAPGGTQGGFEMAGIELQVVGHANPVLVDLHPSLAPSGRHQPSASIDDGAPLTCTTDLECSAYASSGPFGDQLVLIPLPGGSSARTFELAYRTGPTPLFLDPPMVVGFGWDIGERSVAVATPSRCQAAVSSTALEIFETPDFPFGFDDALYQVPESAPSTMPLSGKDAEYRLRLETAEASAVFVHSVNFGSHPVPPSPDLTIEGLPDGPCTPVTTTTTTSTTTTLPVTTTTTTTQPTTTTTTTTTTTSTTLPVAPGTTTTTTTTTTSTTQPQPPTTTSSTTGAADGYVVVTRTGSVHAFGDLDNVGDADATEAVAISLHPSGTGYWILEASGVVHAFGAAASYGDLVLGADERATTMAPTPSGDGYWLITNTGRVNALGDARHHGDLVAFELAGDIIDAAATPSGNGYYLVGFDGGIFAFGDASFAGSIPQVLPGVTLDQPVVGLTPDPDGRGYWLVAADGGVFGFDAPFRGSIPGVLPLGTHLAAAINGMVPFGDGYLLVAGDGGVFNFSNRPFLGSLGNTTLDSAITAIAAT